MTSFSTRAAFLGAAAMIMAGAAPAAALSIVETNLANTSVSISWNTDVERLPAPATGTLEFAGFAGPGTLTAVVLVMRSTLTGSSVAFLRAEPELGAPAFITGDSVDGTAQIGLGALSASQTMRVGVGDEIPFDVVGDLLTTRNTFGAALKPDAFTGPTVRFDLSLQMIAGTGDYHSMSWSADTAATLEYIYVTDVPLPAALPLMTIGLGALGFAARRRG
jgi:hypothetical protein